MKLRRITGGSIEDLVLDDRTISTIRDAYFPVSDAEASMLLTDGTGRWGVSKQSSARATKLAAEGQRKRKTLKRINDAEVAAKQKAQKARAKQLAVVEEERRRAEEERVAPAIQRCEDCVAFVDQFVPVASGRDGRALFQWLQGRQWLNDDADSEA